jgi:multiple sugar transport system permease protein
LFVFSILPIIAAFGLGFMDWTLLSPPKWVGLDNFQRIQSDTIFWTALKNTLYYTFGVLPGIAISLLLAVLLNQKLRATTVFRTIYYLPTITMWVAIGLVWVWLYSPQYGLVNWILLAGLQGIPTVYYEASSIDGASGWQQFRHVTLPLLSPTLYFVLVMTFIGSFGVFTQIYVMTEGGPGLATTTLIYYLYNTAFRYYDIGYANVIAIAFFVIVFTFTIVLRQIQKRWVHYA